MTLICNDSSNGFKNKNLFNLIFILFLLFVIMSSCNGQVKKENEQLLSMIDKNNFILKDSLHQPQINVRVNKQFDKNGNIIKYDSTYSYVYKGNVGQSMRMNNDSVFNQFKSYFNMHSLDMFDMFDKQNNTIFFNDSLFKYDFFNDNYFQKRFELNQNMFNNFYKQMDSLKENYLKKNYPKKSKI